MNTIIQNRRLVFALAFTFSLFISMTTLANPRLGNLKNTMKEMGAKLKTISLQINNPNQNSQSAILANEIAQLAIDSKEFIPTLISNAPPGEQATLKRQYDAMMDQTLQLATELSQALRENNNAQAKIIVDKLAQNKKDGHADFK